MEVVEREQLHVDDRSVLHAGSLERRAMVRARRRGRRITHSGRKRTEERIPHVQFPMDIRPIGGKLGRSKIRARAGRMALTWDVGSDFPAGCSERTPESSICTNSLFQGMMNPIE